MSLPPTESLTPTGMLRSAVKLIFSWAVISFFIYHKMCHHLFLLLKPTPVRYPSSICDRKLKAARSFAFSLKTCN